MHGQMVEFQSNGGTTQAYLSLPESGSGPGVIVLQEWWGLVDHIKHIVDRFAAEGFVALAPDLYHGESTDKPDQAGKLMMALNIDQVEKDLRGAVDYLTAREETTSQGVATVGFCMGGQLSLYAACANQNVSACVNYYGIHPNVNPDIANLKAPVMGFFAEKDGFVTPDAVGKLEQQLKDAGKSVDFTIYEGADHAFFNDQRPEVYHEAFAQETWTRMLSFFRSNL